METAEVCGLKLLFSMIFSCQSPSKSSFHLRKLYLWVLNTLHLCGFGYTHLTLDGLQFGAYLFFSDENTIRI